VDDEKDFCLKTVGMILEDLSICAKVSSMSERDVCFTQIGISTKDISLCELV
jgi:hypothetical protein